MIESNGFIASEDIAGFTVGRTIVKTDYSNEHHVLALTLDDGNVLFCYTEYIAQGKAQ